jgi:hypothetical protein
MAFFTSFYRLENLHDENPETLTLDEVELDKNYALIISTNAGLWRYMIGDTIKFTSLCALPHTDNRPYQAFY